MIPQNSLACLLSLRFLILCVLLGSAGCATGASQRGDTSVADAPAPLPTFPTRFFFGDMVYTMDDTEIYSGMGDLEALLQERFPSEKLTEEGQVPEAHLAGMYRNASRGDRHITVEEFDVYKDTFLRAIEHSLPDPLREVRRKRGN